MLSCPVHSGLTNAQGTRKRKLIVTVEGAEYEFEAKDVTPFEPSHARDLPNMVQMQNLHEAPLLYLLQRRLKEVRGGWEAGRTKGWDEG